MRKRCCPCLQHNQHLNGLFEYINKHTFDNGLLGDDLNFNDITMDTEDSLEITTSDVLWQVTNEYRATVDIIALQVLESNGGGVCDSSANWDLLKCVKLLNAKHVVVSECLQLTVSPR